MLSSRANAKMCSVGPPRQREVAYVRGGPGLKARPLRPDPIGVPPIHSPQRLSGAQALVLPLALALALGSSTTARAGKVCEVPSDSGPVALIILASGPKVHAYARTLEGTVARRDAETVIFHDGRVVTADIEAAGRHLNDLGWGARGIKVVASFPAPRARPRGGFG